MYLCPIYTTNIKNKTNHWITTVRRVFGTATTCKFILQIAIRPFCTSKKKKIIIKIHKKKIYILMKFDSSFCTTSEAVRISSQYSAVPYPCSYVYVCVYIHIHSILYTYWWFIKASPSLPPLPLYRGILSKD